MRLDQAVAARFPELSRRKARELIAARRVLVNDRPVGVASREVGEADRIALVEATPEFRIVAKTASWIAVDKPAGIPTQPPKDRQQRSLEELLRVDHRQLFVVHRIDTQTSGLVMFALTKDAAARLSALFASRAIRKTYAAVIEGELANEVTIETPIEGKEALTILRPLRVLSEARMLVEAEIHTGRTHQIRVHAASIGHPVIGDRRYGSTAKASRMLLHAWKLEHDELGGTLVAPWPGDFPAL